MRKLTKYEEGVLKQKGAIDPYKWWTHANNYPSIDAEAALENIIARYGSSYEAKKDLPGYRTRSETATQEELDSDAEMHRHAAQSCINKQQSIDGTYTPPVPRPKDETIHVLSAEEREIFERAMPAEEVDEYAARKWLDNGFAGALSEFSTLPVINSHDAP